MSVQCPIIKDNVLLSDGELCSFVSICVPSLWVTLLLQHPRGGHVFQHMHILLHALLPSISTMAPLWAFDELGGLGHEKGKWNMVLLTCCAKSSSKNHHTLGLQLGVMFMC